MDDGLREPDPHGRRSKSARARFTLANTLVLVLVGVAMFVATYVAMRYLPDYDLGAVPPSDEVQTAVPETSTEPPDSGGAQESFVIATEADVLDTLVIVSGGALVLACALGALATWILTGRLLRPLRALTVASEQIADGSLGHRVAESGPDDEFRELAEAFNNMLDRLERSAVAQRRFAANASHELQTPLSTTKLLLDLSQDDPLQVDLPELLGQLSDSTARSIRIVNALLDLSDLDHQRLDKSPIDLAALVAEEVETIRPEAGGRQIAIAVDLADTTTVGDPTLIRQLVSNLLRNAVRHNVVGGSVRVLTRVGESQGHAVVELRISNTGAPLSPATLATLTEPFYRAAGRHDAATSTPRREQGKTHGLGLSLVQGIVEAHDGDLTLTALQPGGLLAAVRLPAEVDYESTT
ncbi:sensor histidine kinase [Microbacterium sp. NPDC090281]|uniref:sensor histidine kinase n=1 Tax=Microbacterium sp. NPDC090281 TaxID=3364208 RepID=UPI0037FB748C